MSFIVKSLFISLLVLIYALPAYNQNLSEYRVEINRLELDIQLLKAELNRLNLNFNSQQKTDSSDAFISYEELSKNELLKVGKSHYELFKFHTTQDFEIDKWYFIVLPKSEQLVIGKFNGYVKRKKIFSNDVDKYEVPKDYFKIYELEEVIKRLPPQNDDVKNKESKLSTTDYQEKKNELETIIAEKEIKIEGLRDQIRKIENAKIEATALEKNKIEEIIKNSKFNPGDNAYHKSLNGEVINLGRPTLSHWNYLDFEDLENDYLNSAEFKQAFINKFGLNNYQKIQEGRIRIGDIKEIIPYIFGLPNDVNRSVGSWGVHEQWVYRNHDMYIYVENGKIVSWQD